MQAKQPSTQWNISIRTGQARDLETVGDLWFELMSLHARLDPRFTVPPQGRASYIRHVHTALRDDNYRLLVAEARGEVHGYVLGYIGQNPPMFPQTRYGFIADLCVTRDWRRHGVGSGLVRAMCQWFRAQGLRNIQLNVAHLNPDSQAFWRKTGCVDYLDHMWLDLT